jgi:hypothetical protein
MIRWLLARMRLMRAAFVTSTPSHIWHVSAIQSPFYHLSIERWIAISTDNGHAWAHRL